MKAYFRIEKIEKFAKFAKERKQERNAGKIEFLRLHLRTFVVFDQCPGQRQNLEKEQENGQDVHARFERI